MKYQQPNQLLKKGPFIYEILTFADRGGGYPKLLIQNYTLNEIKNEANGSNHEIN